MTSVLIIQDHSLIVLSQNLMCFPRDRIKIFRLKWKDFIVAGRCYQVWLLGTRQENPNLIYYLLICPSHLADLFLDPK